MKKRRPQSQSSKKQNLCVWWDYHVAMNHGLLKTRETVDTSRYQQQPIDLNLAELE